jgi:hypothetical protein
LDRNARAAVSVARSAATTPAADSAVRRGNASVPGRMPCNSATYRTSLAPRQSTSNPSKAGAGSAAVAAKT